MATKHFKRTLALLLLVMVAFVLGKFHVPNPFYGFWDGPVGG